jgi:predicted nucleic acid-binding protein
MNAEPPGRRPARVILVDSSVWVFADRGRRPIGDFVETDDIVICPPIAQELLQGAQDRERYWAIRDVLALVPMLDAAIPLARFQEAAWIYVRCREAGYTIRSSVDCLIAACALAHDATLLHNDRDFDHIAEVVVALKARRLTPSRS